MEKKLPRGGKGSNETRVTLVGSLVNLLLALAKLGVGIIGSSTAMIADGIHSFSDLATDLVVLLGVVSARRPRDEGHRYGHGKIETLTTALIAMILLGVGAGIGFSAVKMLYEAARGSYPAVPSWIALLGALVSIVFKELLFRYTIRAGRNTGSKALIANAWHHRSDSLSSFAALLGILGAVILGGSWSILDPIAALVVTALIVWISIKLMKECVNELLEGSLGEEVDARVIFVANSVEGVKDPHNLKTRSLGRSVAVDLHVKVDHRMSVKKGHDVAQELENRLRDEFGNEAVINIHVDPDDI